MTSIADQGIQYATRKLIENGLVKIHNNVEYFVLKKGRGQYKAPAKDRKWQSKTLQIVWLINAYYRSYLNNMPKEIRKEALSYILEFHGLKRTNRHTLIEILYAVNLWE